MKREKLSCGGHSSRRELLAMLGLASGLVAIKSAAAVPVPSSHEADFDFLMGSWQVRHRRLVGRLVGSKEWQDFDGTCLARKILGRSGNMDENVIHLPSGTYQGVSLRLYDPQSSAWSIYWVDSRTTSLDPPVIGRFAGKLGTFFGSSALRDRPVQVRYLWFVDGPDVCRWEQAFSTTKAGPWETNWTMLFTRVV